MLKLYVGEMENGLGFPDHHFEGELPYGIIMEDFARKAILHIDKSEVKGEDIVSSPILGGIPANNISTGAKNVIVMMYDDTVVCSLDFCGENCIPLIIEIAKQKDLTVYAKNHKDFFKHGGIDEILILNDNTKVTNDLDLLLKSMELRGKIKSGWEETVSSIRETNGGEVK